MDDVPYDDIRLFETHVLTVITTVIQIITTVKYRPSEKLL